MCVGKWLGCSAGVDSGLAAHLLMKAQRRLRKLARQADERGDPAALRRRHPFARLDQQRARGMSNVQPVQDGQGVAGEQRAVPGRGLRELESALRTE